ncbi:hypothetical protein V3N99_21480 [Dermatophilaceae bacterium Soc4.6]
MSIDTTDLSSDPVADRVVRVQAGIDAAVVANHQVTIRETTRTQATVAVFVPPSHPDAYPLP